MIFIQSYDGIMDLAERGNRCNVDIQVKDVLDMDIESPYGNFPLEMPVLPFGKCGDNNTGLDYLSKFDVASALLALCSTILMENCNVICLRKKVSKVHQFVINFNCTIT